MPLMVIVTDCSATANDAPILRVAGGSPSARSLFLKRPTSACLGRGEYFEATGYLASPSMPSMEWFPSWQAYS
jgi:hypothetical protein